MFNPSSTQSEESIVEPKDSSQEIIHSKRMKAYFIISLILEIVYLIDIILILLSYHLSNLENCLTLYYVIGSLQIPIFVLHCVMEYLSYKLSKKDCRIIADISKSQFYQHWSIIITIFVTVLLEGISLGVGRSCYNYIDENTDDLDEQDLTEEDYDISSCNYIEYGDTTLMLFLVIGECAFGAIFKVPVVKTYIKLRKGVILEADDEDNALFVDAGVGDQYKSGTGTRTESTGRQKCRFCKHSAYHYKVKDNSLSLSRSQAQMIQALQEENKSLAAQMLRLQNGETVRDVDASRDNATSLDAVQASLSRRLRQEVDELQAAVVAARGRLRQAEGERDALALELEGETALSQHQ